MEWVRGETIGYGTFATVSLATPANKVYDFPSLMAVKSTYSDGAASLMNEKSILDQLGHCPEIVRFFGDDRTVENGEEMYNLFFEYASRGNLATHVRKSDGDGLPESSVRCHTLSVLRGLRHIHASGFAHCDIKLENILMFDNGAVKIADFGLAKRIEDFNGEEMIRGTPLFMAPESVKDNEYGSQADVWALGCAVVEMFSGKTAWSLKEGSNFMALLIRIGVGDELPRIPEELSEEGRDFLSKCFVKDPKKRWTAEMLLKHPFVAVDVLRNVDDHQHQIKDFVLDFKKDKVSASPKGPFDFPDWISESLDSQSQYQPLDSPAEIIGGLATDCFPDWSVTENWVTVR